MPTITLNITTRQDRIIKAHCDRTGKTLDQAFDPFVREIVRAEVEADDPILDIKPAVAQLEARAAAAVAARQAAAPGGA